MVEGISGLRSCCWHNDRTIRGDHLGRPLYEPSKRRLTWANGAIATLFSAEEPERLRGPQHDTIWADELAAWMYMQEAWDMAMFGLRLGSDPRAMVTTTPKPLPLIRELVKDQRNIVTRGTSWDNRANLARTFFDTVVKRYQGTRLGRQELEGQILEEADGALWSRDLIRPIEAAPPLVRIVVAVDPPASSSGESALAGIVAAGIGFNGNGYVLADYSGRMTPGQWAKKVVQAYDTWKADRVVAEGNQGGEMVAHTIQTERKNIPITVVHASRSKQARAEPVAALYEQGKVFHVGAFPELEDEMCTWEPLSGLPSPDRLDALVWAMTDLAIDGGTPVFAVPEATFVQDAVLLQSIWRRCAAIEMDTGLLGALWAAHHITTDTIYVYDEMLGPRGAVPVHAEAIRKRGPWIPVLFDLEGKKRSLDEGANIATHYAENSVDLYEMPIDMAAALDEMQSRLATGRLKVFSHLSGLLAQYRRFRRDDKSEIVEEDDLLIRCLAAIVMGISIAKSENQAASDEAGYDPVFEAERGATGY